MKTAAVEGVADKVDEDTCKVGTAYKADNTLAKGKAVEGKVVVTTGTVVFYPSC